MRRRDSLPSSPGDEQMKLDKKLIPPPTGQHIRFHAANVAKIASNSAIADKLNDNCSADSMSHLLLVILLLVKFYTAISYYIWLSRFIRSRVHSKSSGVEWSVYEMLLLFYITGTVYPVSVALSRTISKIKRYTVWKSLFSITACTSLPRNLVCLWVMIKVQLVSSAISTQ